MRSSLLVSLSLLAITGCDGGKDDTALDTAVADTADTADTVDTAETGDTADTADTADSGDTADTAGDVDGDQDGVTPNQGDCDDANGNAFPGNFENCDGADNDCNGAIDDGALDAVTAYADADADGFGDAASASTVCTVGAGQVENGDDCDDTSALSYPGAAEVCDTADNDCNGIVDDGAVDAGSYFADTDGDGFGDAAAAMMACAAPAGFVVDDSDCDDTTAGSFPGADELCDGEDNSCDGIVDEDPLDGTTAYTDTDGDGHGVLATAFQTCVVGAGFATLGDDCDDANVAVFPGADEYCNGVDDNCDATTDEATAVDAGTFYADTDSDGYGNAAAAQDACTQPVGYVTSATDCNDSAAGVNPGATEVCDASNVDEDCDGAREDADASLDLATRSAFYADTDGDGFTTSLSVLSCDAPTGFAPVSASLDCEDTDATVNPGETEVCGNLVDDDCAASTACDFTGDATLNDADMRILGTTTGERAGSSLTAAGDLNGDGAFDVAIGVPGTSTGQGKVYVWYGPVDSSATLATADVVINGTTGSEQLGIGGLHIVRDVDGDGTDELVVGSPFSDVSTALDAGSVFLFRGNTLTSSMTTAGATARWNGVSAGTSAPVTLADSLGFSVSAVGDTNGDGVGDLVFGAPGRGSTDAGEAYVVSGAFTGTTAVNSGYLAQITGGAAGTGTFSNNAYDYDRMGYATAGFDVDGDGLAEVFLGGPGEDAGAGATNARTGVVLMIEGTTVADIDGDGTAGSRFTQSGGVACGSGTSCPPSAVLTGALAADQFGVALASLGDVNDDGYNDLGVGADYAGASNDGAVYVYGGSARGWSGTIATSAAMATITKEAATSGDFVGRSLRGGDFNQDGIADLIVSAPQNDAGGAGAGAAYVVYGPFSGSVALDSRDAKIRGVAASDAVGRLATGDVDSDGYDDILVGAAGYDPTSLTNAGGVFFFMGSGE